MHGRHIADLQIYLSEAGMQSYIWGRYKNQGNAWRYSNVTVFGSNYTVRTGNERNSNDTKRHHSFLITVGLKDRITND